MFGRLIFNQSYRLVRIIFLGVLALIMLRYLDKNSAHAGLWIFIGLTLTTGFFHGALDIVLLQHESATARQLIITIALYLGSTSVIALVCAQNNLVLITVLLAMSVWHFGEPYGRWMRNTTGQRALIQRVIAGGAPVMLPALLSSHALRTVLPMAVDVDAAWVFTLWQALAWLWVGLCAVGLAIFRRQVLSKSLFIEITGVFILNALLSPLMAFSIYFGVLHAAAHIIRVLGKYRSAASPSEKNSIKVAQNRSSDVAIVVTCLATVLFLLIVIGYVQSTTNALGVNHSFLNGLLVALTAVTFPHLILVSRNAGWLAERSSIHLLK